jgi:hypothetical protein
MAFAVVGIVLGEKVQKETKTRLMKDDSLACKKIITAIYVVGLLEVCLTHISECPSGIRRPSSTLAVSPSCRCGLESGKRILKKSPRDSQGWPIIAVGVSSET